MQLNCRAFTPLLFFLVAGLGAGGGCSSGRTTAPEQPFRGTTLRVAVPVSLETSLRGASHAWQAATAGEVKFLPFDPPAPLPEADLWVVPGWQLPHWIAQNKVQPLPATLAQRDGPGPWSGLLPIHREALVVWFDTAARKRVPYAVPLLGDAPVLCYRSDLYEDKTHQAAYQKETGRPLQPPATWAEFARQARYFADKADLKLPPLPADAVAVERLFGQVVAGYARPPVFEGNLREGPLTEADLVLFQNLDTGTARLAHPGFVAGLQVLQDMQTARAPGNAANPEVAFLDGQAPLCVCEAPWLRRFQESKGLRDKFGVVPLPGAEKFVGPDGERAYDEPNRMPYLGTGLVVAALPTSVPADKLAAATSLLGRLLDPEVSNALVLSPGQAGRVVRSDQLDERVRWDVLGLDVARTRATKDVLRGTVQNRSLRNPALTLRLPDAGWYREVLVQHVRAALGGADARTSLEAVAAAWNEQREKVGAEVLCAQARLSVGLLP